MATDMFVADPVSNAVKHADPEEAGDARLVLRAAEGDDFTLRVADDGVGVERAGRRQGSGLGSRTFGSPVRRLGSDLRYEGPGQGSCVVLDVSDAVAMPPDDATRRAP
jgi:two-component sensor histidine kinase